MYTHSYAALFRQASTTIWRILVAAGSAASLAFAVLAAELPASVLIQNPGFELSDTANPAQPLNWSKSTPGSVITVDDKVKAQGGRSLRIERAADARFSGIAQTIPAILWRGKLISVRAMLKSENVAGATGIFIRAEDASRKTVALGNSFATPIAGTADWTSREAIVDIPVEAAAISIGAGFSSGERIWVDAFELSEVRLESLRPLGDSAKAYLDDAIKIIESIALNSTKVDWPRTRLKAYALAQGASGNADTYAAIRMVLSALNDRHSLLMLPADSRVNSENTTANDFKLLSEAIANKAYVSVPAYQGSHSDRQTAFANELQSRLGALDTSKPCAWIVDLRANSGGNMFPMLAGLAPILGDGVFGHLLGSDGAQDWFVREAGSGLGTQINARTTKPVPLVAGGEAAVAILLGPQTASSGEAIAVSFIDRPNTRSFGQPTAGLSTGNRPVTLSDGATLIVTTSVFADRNGKSYGGKIDPDQIVAPGPKDAPLADDPVVRAAIAWLDQQPACRK